MDMFQMQMLLAFDTRTHFIFLKCFLLLKLCPLSPVSTNKAAWLSKLNLCVQIYFYCLNPENARGWTFAPTATVLIRPLHMEDI